MMTMRLLAYLRYSKCLGAITNAKVRALLINITAIKCCASSGKSLRIGTTFNRESAEIAR